MTTPLTPDATAIAAALDEIATLTAHGIPYYAYGDNEAGCDMARGLTQIVGHVRSAAAGLAALVEENARLRKELDTLMMQAQGEADWRYSLTAQLVTLREALVLLEVKRDHEQNAVWVHGAAAAAHAVEAALAATAPKAGP